MHVAGRTFALFGDDTVRNYHTGIWVIVLKTKFSFLVLTAVVLANAPAHAVDDGTKKQLLKIEPTARLEQACDIELMSQINKSHHEFRVDKVIAYTVSDPSYKDDSIDAEGASFRSRGDWYFLAYQCKTGPRHIEVKALSYKIGDKVERKDWKKYSLYD